MASAEYMREYRRRKPEVVSAVNHRHYQNHKENYARYRDSARIRIHKLVRSEREKPCTDCGGIFPWYVMEFDHVRGKKKFSIARATVHGIEQVKEELKKCDIVCANCHVIRTYKRGQWFRGNQCKFRSPDPMDRRLEVPSSTLNGVGKEAADGRVSSCN